MAGKTHTVKRDNSNLAEKLALRRMVIQSADLGPLRVLETCAGLGIMWRELRKEFPVAAYTPCDIKPRMRGCIQLEMTDRNLGAFDMARYNLVDIDPYGDPWVAWLNLSKRLKHKTVFFLTHGMARTPAGGAFKPRANKDLLRANGIPGDWKIPGDYQFALDLGLRLLHKSSSYLEITRCLMTQHRFVRYYGVICSPIATPGTECNAKTNSAAS